MLNELRLWNWVYAGGDYRQVAGIDRHGSISLYRDGSYSDDGINIKLIKPIPLIPEILEQCGFTRKIQHNDSFWWFPLPKDKSVKLEIATFKDTLEIEIDRGYDNASEIYDIPCKYLHQLQNLIFAFTGEELEVNLSHVATTV